MTISSAPPPAPPPDDCPECEESTEANGWDADLGVCGVCAETHEAESAAVDAEWGDSLDEENYLGDDSEAAEDSEEDFG